MVGLFDSAGTDGVSSNCCVRERLLHRGWLVWLWRAVRVYLLPTDGAIRQGTGRTTETAQQLLRGERRRCLI